MKPLTQSEVAYIFEGDGRKMVEPREDWSFPGNPIAVRRSVAKALGRHFEEAGYSNHSDAGNTLWVVIAYCQYKGHGVEVIKHELGGWFVRKVH
jgi:hypothetical protein